MSAIFLNRGGTPDFKGFMCEGQWAQFLPPYDAPHQPHTPPFDDHADAAYGQGYLNLNFSLVPNLDGTYAHRWMQDALKNKAFGNVGDQLFLVRVPMRSFVDSLYIEVQTTDPALTGVYVKPVAHRMTYNFTTGEYVHEAIDDFATEMTNWGMTNYPLGTPKEGDKLYGFARLSNGTSGLPTTFGHNITTKDATGKSTAGIDKYFGTVLIGLEVTAGDTAKIQSIWKSNIEVYLSTKVLSFEASTQMG